MNTPQTRFVTLSVMKVTNTEHTAIESAKKVDITNWCKYSILNPYAILKAGNQSSL